MANLYDKRLYVCANHGEFANCERYQKKEYFTCGWGALETSADLFRDYKDAYNHCQRINRLYGFERCYVQKLLATEYTPYYWEQMVQSMKDREKSWWHQDYVRHEFAKCKW